MDTMIIVDMQVGLINGEPKHDLSGVIERINRLTAMIRKCRGKVFWIQHCGSAGDDFEPNTPGWSFLPELDYRETDLVVHKTLNDPFAGTDLQGTLADLSPDRFWSPGGPLISASMRLSGRRSRIIIMSSSSATDTP